MKNFIKTPNLPERPVTSVIVDYRTNPDSIKMLNSLGICVYTTKRIDSLYEAVSGHPDMILHHLGGEKLIIAPDSIDLNIPDADVIIGKSSLKSLYPYDIHYNACRVGNFLIHNFKYTDNSILKNSDSLIKIHVKQGYSKCSVCIINEKAIITSDTGIFKKCKEFNLDTLLIDDSDILLKGVSHGFFGGSSGLISPELLAVNGDIKTHRNYKEIKAFCDKHSVKILSLHSGAIEDIGSIIPLTE